MALKKKNWESIPRDNYDIIHLDTNCCETQKYDVKKKKKETQEVILNLYSVFNTNQKG